MPGSFSVEFNRIRVDVYFSLFFVRECTGKLPVALPFILHRVSERGPAIITVLNR
jgi:hypothetical protein